jgi:hypothetical protein
MASGPRPSHGPQRRFARQLREAALRATHSEFQALEVIAAAVMAGDMTAVEGSRRVRMMLRGQQERARGEGEAA